jgi:type I restriction enzyme S subunit
MAEWIHTTLGNIVDIQMGQSPKSEFYNTNGDGLPFLQGNRTFGMKYPFFDTYTTYIMKTAELNDIIMSVRAPVGDLNIAKNRICLGRGVCGLRMKNGEYEFLYYLLKANTVNILELETGTIFGSINKSDISKLIVTIPKDITKQKAIASVLSNLDDKIDLLHRQNKTLEAMAETIYRQWFIEEASDNWKTGILSNEFIITMGQSPPGVSYNENKIGIPMFQGNADFTFRFPKERVFTTAPTRFAEKFDTLISVRAPVGTQNMAMTKCCIGRGLAAFSYRHNSQFYTYTYFKLRSLMRYISEFNNEGTVFGSINKSDLSSINILIPEYSEVIRFETHTKSINDKIILNSYQITNLENIKNILLPKLIQGSIKLVY